ncbi:DUF4030 domain-containing protein [Lysinibacillus sp. NPDC096418]|uniref:DUF4030 domain-containing protein n=1 Tax=Lysinibacillus sp. NPDC096418 TaxID=3364138 RepID=UPI0038274FB7
MEQKTQKVKIRKRVPISITVILFTLLIACNFVSPTINNALAKAAFFHLLFDPKPDNHTIVNSIHKQLSSKNYEVENVGLNLLKKVITVNISGSKNYFNISKKEIEKEVNVFLHSIELDTYKVEIAHYPQRQLEDKLIDEEMKRIKKSQELEKAIMNDPRLQEYKLISAFVRINDVENYIPLVLSDKERKIGDIIRIVNSIVKEQGMEPFTIKPFYVDSEKENIAQKLQPVINTLSEEFKRNEEYQVTGIYYAFDTPLTFSVKTGLSTTDANSKKHAQKIEEMIEDVLHNKEVTNILPDGQYKIIVYSRDNTPFENVNSRLADFQWN